MKGNLLSCKWCDYIRDFGARWVEKQLGPQRVTSRWLHRNSSVGLIGALSGSSLCQGTDVCLISPHLLNPVPGSLLSYLQCPLLILQICTVKYKGYNLGLQLPFVLPLVWMCFRELRWSSLEPSISSFPNKGRLQVSFSFMFQLVLPFLYQIEICQGHMISILL